MLPNMLFWSFRHDNSRKKKNQIEVETDPTDPQHLRHSVPFYRDPAVKQATRFSLRSDISKNRNGGIKAKKMVSKVSNLSDLIQRVTASCLMHPLVAGGHEAEYVSDNHAGDESEDDRYKTEGEEEDEDGVWEGADDGERTDVVIAMKMLMGEVFDAVSAMKMAYVSLQEAHCPWDPDKMRVADVAVVAELRRLGVLTHPKRIPFLLFS